MAYIDGDNLTASTEAVVEGAVAVEGARPSSEREDGSPASSQANGDETAASSSVTQFHRERSALRSRQAKEEKQLQKAIRRVKGGAKKAALEDQWKELETKNVAELTALADKYGIAHHNLGPVLDADEPSAPKPAAVSAHAEESQEVVVPKKGWMKENTRRGKSAKQVDRGGTETEGGLLAAGLGQESRADSESRKSAGSSADDSDSEREDEKNSDRFVDVPTSEMQRSGTKADARGAERRCQMLRNKKWGRDDRVRPSQVGRTGKRSSPTEESDSETQIGDPRPSDDDIDAQCRRREEVVVKHLVKILAKKPNGFSVDDLTSELEQRNVSGFRPELLGYQSEVKFLAAQSPETLNFDQLDMWVYPAKVSSRNK